MGDELRGHDPRPTDEERAWMEMNPFSAVRRIAVLILLAFSVAGYLGYAFDSDKPAVVATRHAG